MGNFFSEYFQSEKASEALFYSEKNQKSFFRLAFFAIYRTFLEIIGSILLLYTKYPFWIIVAAVI